MQEDSYNQWASLIGEVILGFGTIECWTRHLVEISSGDEGTVHQGSNFESRINRVISLLEQEPECHVARMYGKERLERALTAARTLKSVRNDIAHNPLEINSGTLTIYDESVTVSTGDVSYCRKYTLQDLCSKRVELNDLLREIRLMQQDGANLPTRSE